MWHRILIISIFIVLQMHSTTQPLHAAIPCIPSDDQICVSGDIQKFWQANNGVQLFGQPIDNSSAHRFIHEAYHIQNFERARIEFRFSQPKPYNFQLGLIGKEWLDRYSSELSPLKPSDEATLQGTHASCVGLPNAQYTVCGAFRTFYQGHGLKFDNLIFASNAESLALFGLPLTPAMRWTRNGQTYIVQLFERARFEYHTATPTKPIVMLGRINAELRENAPPQQTIATLNDSFLVDTQVPLLPANIVAGFGYRMPTDGYWEAASKGIYIAAGTFRYQETFYETPIAEKHRFVSMAILVKNQRTAQEPAVYYDYRYINLIDTLGRRYAAAPTAMYLKTPILGTTLNPGELYSGQMIFAIPDDAIPAQIKCNFANLDTDQSRFQQNLELRVWPIIPS
jgi:hypothetical protein